ncbi:hypothetical protein ACGC1H_002057 [Rhizoctonia solani]
MPNPNTQLGGVLPKSIGKFLAATGSSAIKPLNRILAPKYGRPQYPHRIDFTEGWRKGATEEWYRSQSSTEFKYLEYRKEREYPFYHEYILVHLSDELVCRFDRRGDINSRANGLVGEPIPSEDTVYVIAKDDDVLYPDIEDWSDLVLRIHFPKGQDIHLQRWVISGVSGSNLKCSTEWLPEKVPPIVSGSHSVEHFKFFQRQPIFADVKSPQAPSPLLAENRCNIF